MLMGHSLKPSKHGRDPNTISRTREDRRNFVVRNCRVSCATRITSK